MCRKNKPVQSSFFDVFMIREGQTGVIVSYARGLIIPDVKAPRSRGLTSLVIALDRPLASFLGDSENPSHTQWQHDGSHFKGKYKSGHSDLKFVSDSVRHIYRLLTASENERTEIFLQIYLTCQMGYFQKRKPGRTKKATRMRGKTARRKESAYSISRAWMAALS